MGAIEAAAGQRLSIRKKRRLSLGGPYREAARVEWRPSTPDPATGLVRWRALGGHLLTFEPTD